MEEPLVAAAEPSRRPTAFLPAGPRGVTEPSLAHRAALSLAHRAALNRYGAARLAAAALACAGIITLAGPAAAQVCGADNLIGYWPMSGNANDASGCGRNGAVSGASLTTDFAGATNEAYDFDGVNDQVALTPYFGLSLPVTVSLLVNHDCPSSGNCWLFDSDGSTTQYSGFSFVLQNGGTQVSSQYGDGGPPGPGNRRSATAPLSVPPGEWHHLVLVLRGPTDAEFYVDGVQVPPGNVVYSGTGSAMAQLDNQARIGFDGGVFNSHYRGKLDEVRFYNRAFDAFEIKTLDPRTGCGTDGLIGYWPMSGNASDASGCDQNGSVSGASLTTDFTGATNEAYDFDGVNDQIAVPNYGQPSLPLTVAMLVNHDCPSTGLCTLFESDASPTQYAGVSFVLQEGGTVLSSQYGDGGAPGPGNRRSATLPVSVPPGEWRHLALVLRGPTDAEFYVDGVRLAPGSVAYSGSGSAMVHLGNSALIGADGGVFDAPYRGKLDQVRFYDSALSALEIVNIVPPICGNGVVQSGESCDDGNAISEDGCSASCQVEFCGDGVLQPGLGEACDDGNFVSEDGCSATCQPEFCGDSVLQPGLGEVCDDGNMASLDGCSAFCTVEESVTVLGTAAGGGFEIELGGVVVTVATSGGETSAQVAQAIAAAINVDPTLMGQGVQAQASGDEVFTSGDYTGFTGTDPEVGLGTGEPPIFDDLSVIPRRLDLDALADGILLPSPTTLEGVEISYAIPGETVLATDAFETTSPPNSLGLTGGDFAFLDGDAVDFAFPRPLLAVGVWVVTSDPALPGEIRLTTPRGTTGNGPAAGQTGDGGYLYFLGHASTSTFTTATLDFAADGETNFVFNIDDVEAAVPTVYMQTFQGTATGGFTVRVDIDGEVVEITTNPGESAETVAQALADAINATSALKAQGTAAAAEGGELLSNGTVTMFANNDPGLGGAVAVPGLGPWGVALLAGLLACFGRRISRRRWEP